MKCPICRKPIKENTEGDKRYCQGHDIFETGAYGNKADNSPFKCISCGLKYPAELSDDGYYCIHCKE